MSSFEFIIHSKLCSNQGKVQRNSELEPRPFPFSSDFANETIVPSYYFCVSLTYLIFSFAWTSIGPRYRRQSSNNRPEYPGEVRFGNGVTYNKNHSRRAVRIKEMRAKERERGAWMEKQCTPYINIVPITRSPGGYRSWRTTTATTTELPWPPLTWVRRTNSAELPGPAFRDSRWGLGRWKSGERVPTKGQTRRAIIYDVYRVGFVQVARSAIFQHPSWCK